MSIADRIVGAIQELVPPGAPEPSDPDVICRLEALTAKLIRARGIDALRRDPFAEARSSLVELNEATFNALVAGATVLVTGGLGMVGSHIIAQLLRTPAARILCVDSRRGPTPTHYPLPANADPRVMHVQVDIRDWDALAEPFERERPQIVFHLANGALNPGDAEFRVRETVTTNLEGTQHILDLCERYGVERCVYSSTGKAAHYVTTDVYAATKKLTERQVAAAANGTVGYAVVRFTHIVENSPISWKIERMLERGLVALHAPDRNFYAQSVQQAVGLLLNAALLTRPDGSLLVLRDLGWPVCLLDLALHKIVVTGRPAALYFEGLPPAGYLAYGFPGLLDRGQSGDANPLLNLLEASTAVRVASEQLLAAKLPAAPEGLPAELALLSAAAAAGAAPADLKARCAAHVRALAEWDFAAADPALVLTILKWGADARQLRSLGLSLATFEDELKLLVGALRGRLSPAVLRRIDSAPPTLAELADALAELPALADFASELRKAVAQERG